jgi:hypothetical protein
MNDEEYARLIQANLDALMDGEEEAVLAYDKYVRTCNAILQEMQGGRNQRRLKALNRQRIKEYTDFMRLHRVQFRRRSEIYDALLSWHPSDSGYMEFYVLANRNFIYYERLLHDRRENVEQLGDTMEEQVGSNE